jgi:enoyl-CoA hydratase/carnithine racemase
VPPAPAHLRVERPSGGVALLTLANPEQRNAMSPAMTSAWVDAIDELASDASVRAVVVTGEGSAFCSGGDTSWLASEPDASVDRLRARMLPFYRSWLSIRRLEVPTIAAINGAAIGAGLCLPLACDIRVASTRARMGVPFTRLGMHSGMGATYLLPDVVGHSTARDLLLTGRLVDAQEALRIGLVSRVLPEENFLSAALELATDVAAAAPVASKLTKVALSSQFDSLDAALQWEALAQPVTLATEDLQEGVTAARERRTAHFAGR